MNMENTRLAIAFEGACNFAEQMCDESITTYNPVALSHIYKRAKVQGNLHRNSTDFDKREMASYLLEFCDLVDKDDSLSFC